jgi:hypothetical protein
LEWTCVNVEWMDEMADGDRGIVLMVGTGRVCLKLGEWKAEKQWMN